MIVSSDVDTIGVSTVRADDSGLGATTVASETDTLDVEEKKTIKPPTIEEVSEFVDLVRDSNPVQFIASKIPMPDQVGGLSDVAKQAMAKKVSNGLTDDPTVWAMYKHYQEDPESFITDQAAKLQALKEDDFLKGFADTFGFNSLSTHKEVEHTGSATEMAGELTGSIVRDTLMYLALPEAGFATSVGVGEGLSAYNKEIGAGKDTDDAVKAAVATGVANYAGVLVGTSLLPLASKMTLGRFNHLVPKGIISTGVRGVESGAEFVGWEATSAMVNNTMREQMGVKDGYVNYSSDDALRSFVVGATAGASFSFIKQAYDAVAGKATAKATVLQAVESIDRDLQGLAPHFSPKATYVMSGEEMTTLSNTVREALKADSSLTKKDAIIKVFNQLDMKARSEENMRRLLVELQDVL